jgi:hypothetical protein
MTMLANKAESSNPNFASVTNEDITLRYEISRLADAPTIPGNQRGSRHSAAGIARRCLHCTSSTQKAP